VLAAALLFSLWIASYRESFIPGGPSPAFTTAKIRFTPDWTLPLDIAVAGIGPILALLSYRQGRHR